MEYGVSTTIKSIIREKGYKQNVIAEKAGFSEKQFSNIVTGRKFIAADDVLSICRALDVTPNELLGYKQEKGA